jgi:hypothetical protein
MPEKTQWGRWLEEVVKASEAANLASTPEPPIHSKVSTGIKHH